MWYFKLISCHFLGWRTGKPHPEPWFHGRSWGRVSEASICLGRTGSWRSWRILLLQDRMKWWGCGNLAGAVTVWHCFSFKMSIHCVFSFTKNRNMCSPTGHLENREMQCTDEQKKKSDIYFISYVSVLSQAPSLVTRCESA